MADRQRIISADSHVTIPRDKILEHLPSRLHQPLAEAEAAYGARMLKAKPQKVKQQEALSSPLPNMGAGAPWPAAGRPGGTDPVERLKDMDIDGVEAEILYIGSGGASYYDLGADHIEAFRASNSAAIEWASLDPKRLMPVYLLPIVDVAVAVKEVERIAAEHGKAVQLPLVPREVGAPPYWDPSYDPLWDILSATGIPISQHVGSNEYLNTIMAEDQTPFKGIFQSLPPMFMSECVADWTVSGVLERWPNLKIVLVESGIGWLPYYLERLDTMVTNHGWNTFADNPLKEKPSFYWHRNMAATFEQDLIGVRNRYEIGVENLMWATDYPHPDSTWPNSQAVLREHFEGVPADEVELIAAGNAARIYNL
ncbi:MAG: amidohydrolase family protein [Acidimicrobiia bacterium]